MTKFLNNTAKELFLKTIIAYQKVGSPILKQLFGINKQCRYLPTCSEYAKIVVKKHGVVKGSVLSAKRFISCSPFAKQNLKFSP